MPQDQDIQKGKFIDRSQLLGGNQAEMRSRPEPSMARKFLEMATGYPADPDREMGPIETVMAMAPGIGGLGKAAHVAEGLRAAAPAAGGISAEAARAAKAIKGMGAERARMARAAEQGFTTPVYHGTRNPEMREFYSPIATDPGEHDFGIHVTPRAETANSYLGVPEDVTKNVLENAALHADPARYASAAGAPGKAVMPLLARIQNPLPVPDMGMFRSPRMWLQKLGTQEQRIPYDIGGGQTTDWVTKVEPMGSPAIGASLTPEQKKAYAALLDVAEKHDPSYMAHAGPQIEFQQDIIDTLQRHGYDALEYPNTIEGAGESSYALLDPRQLRSRFAQFDPARFGKTKDILAGVAPPLAGLAAAGQMNKDQKR